MKRVLWLSFAVAGFLGCSHVEKKTEIVDVPSRYTSPEQIPVEDFFRNPSVFGFRVSPDGKMIAELRSWKNRLNVFVFPTNDPMNVKQLTFVEDRDIQGASWKGNGHVLYSRDFNGDENFQIFAVDVKTGETKNLTPYAGSRSEMVDDLADVSPTDVMIQNNRRDKEVFDLYRVNIETGISQMAARNENKITSWLLDHEGRVRGGTAQDGVTSVFYFETKKGEGFRPIFKTDFRNLFAPIAFTADNKDLYVATNLGRDLVELVEVNPELPAKKFIVKTIYSHPKYDLESANYSLQRKDIDMVQVVTDRREIYFLDKDDKKDWADLKAKYPNDGLIFANSSRNERIWVYKTFSDRSFGAYYAYDRDTKKITALGEVSPWLQSDLMAPMKTVHYKTRDGLTIEAYLTLPLIGAKTNLPTVINPHGGPWARDEWRFDSEVQFLASRGYAVLQMNYRGSTGYGRKFWQASFKQWGKKMQNDITDGVRWLEKQKIADSKRVAIYGGSYGGYATLAGVTFTPNLYACAVDYVGVANLFTFMNTIPPYWKPYLDMMHTMVGDPIKDKSLLASASPVLHADRIKAPLFIAQGAHDPRVNKNESDQMVAALHKRGIEVEYMVKDNEGHGFHNQENRFDFYHAMEKFLAKHLKGTAG